MKLMEIKEYSNAEYNGTIYISDTKQFTSFLTLEDDKKIISRLMNDVPNTYIPYCKLNGDLKLSNISLDNLKGCPHHITGDWQMYDVVIGTKDLSFGPEIIDGDVAINDGISSLKGFPKKIGGRLKIEYCFRGMTSVKYLWNCDMNFNKIIFKGIFNYPELNDAFELLIKHKLAGTRNYFEVMKDARERGLEEYFK